MSKIKVNELEPISGTTLYVTGTVSASIDLYCAGNTEIAGNLTVNGTTTTIDTTNLVVEDPLLVLAKNVSGTPSYDAGFVVERGTSTNVAIIWDESADEFAVINTTEAGTTAGNVSIASYADLHASGMFTAENIGVGTTSPGSQIEVEGSSGDLTIEIDNNVANSANFKITSGAGNNRVDMVANALTGNPAALADTTITMKDQRVGIMDTSPSYTLDVGGNGRFTGNLIVSGTMTFGDASGDTVTFNASTVSIPNNLNFDSNTLVLDASNNRIGIGTASPSNVLEIEGSSGDLVFEIDNNASNSANFQIQNGAGNARVDLVMNDGSTNTTITMKDQKVGILDTSPSYGLDVNGTLRAVGLATFDAGLSAGDANITNVGDIALDSISSDAGTSINVTLGTDDGDDFIVATSAFVVEGDTKRIGIGTATPSSSLEIEGSSGDLIFEIDNNVSNSANFQIQNGAGNARVDLVMNDGSTNTTITMKDQKVGINDTSPSYTLDIAGDGRFTTNLLVGDDLSLTSDSSVLNFGAGNDVTFTHDGVTGMNIASAGDFDITSTAGNVTVTSQVDEAASIYLRENAGTSGAIKIHADQGTSVTEGAASVQLLSDAGGIGIKSTANLANAILLTADGGTSETIKIHADRGTDAASIELASDAGGVTISAGNTTHGVKLGTVSGAPITIGHTTSETTVADNLTVTGDLTVNGTTTTINSTTLTVDDLNVVLASGAADSAAADGAGITVDGASATILYDHTGTQWEMNKPLEVQGDIMPQADSAYDLGTSSLQFAEAHIDAGYIDAVTVTGTSTLTTVDINGGNIDGTVIGAASTAAATFTTCDATTNFTIDGLVITADTITNDAVLSINAAGIALGAGSAELDLTTTGTLDINANALDMDLTDSSTITITSSEAAEDLTISQVGANDSSILITAAGTGSDAISIDATAGDMVIAPSLADGKTLKLGKNGAVEMVFTPHGTAGSEKFLLTNTAGTADDAIKLTSVAGGVTIHAGNDSLHIDADGTDADALNIDSAGGIDVDAAGAITIDAVGIALGAGSGELDLTTTGTMDINSAALDIDTSGAITIDAAGVASHIALVTAHTAGVAFHLDADANAGSIVDIDAGILDIDVTAGTTLNTTGLTITDITTSSATEGGFIRLVSDDGAALADDHRLGVIEFAGAEDGSSTITVGAKIEAICDAGWSASENGAALVMTTTDANASQSEVLRLDSDKLATFKGRVITDDATDATSTTDGSLQTDGGLSVAKDVIAGNDVYLLTDSSVLGFGIGKDATLTHDGTTGLTIAATPISIDSTGALDLNSTTGDINFQDGGATQITLDLDGTAGEVIMQLRVDSDDFVFKQYDGTEVFRVEDNGDFDIAGGLGSSGVTVSAAGAISADGRIITDDATDATSTTDGSIQTDGGLSVAKDVVGGNDILLLSDSAAIKFGINSDIILTHEADRGLVLTQGTETTGEPVFTIKNTGDLASGGGIEFILDNGAGEGDDDILGFISFKGDSSDDSQIQYAQMSVIASDVTREDEGGKFKFEVQSGGITGAASLNEALSIGGEDQANSTNCEVVVNEAGTAFIDFRVEGDDETHLLFVDAGTQAVSIGDSTDAPAATLEVTNHASAGAYNLPLVQLNSNDTDQIALDINAANIDADVIDIVADAVTTANVIDITADALTSGKALNIVSNCASTTARSLATIHQDHASALLAVPLYLQQDGGGAAAAHAALVTYGSIISTIIPTAENTDGAVTFATNVFINGRVIRANLTSSAKSDVTPTAAQLVAAIPGCSTRTSIEFEYVNGDNDQNVILTGGTGVTMINGGSPSFTVTPGKGRRFRVYFTNVSGGSEAARLIPITDLYTVLS